jgi:hypothetical protein
MVIACYCNGGRQIEWSKERGQTTHWLVTIITKPGGVSFIIINLFYFIFCVFFFVFWVIQVTDIEVENNITFIFGGPSSGNNSLGRQSRQQQTQQKLGSLKLKDKII